MDGISVENKSKKKNRMFEKEEWMSLMIVMIEIVPTDIKFSFFLFLLFFPNKEN